MYFSLSNFLSMLFVFSTYSISNNSRDIILADTHQASLKHEFKIPMAQRGTHGTIQSHLILLKPTVKRMNSLISIDLMTYCTKLKARVGNTHHIELEIKHRTLSRFLGDSSKFQSLIKQYAATRLHPLL